MGKSQKREWPQPLEKEGQVGRMREVPEDAGGGRGLELVQRDLLS